MEDLSLRRDKIRGSFCVKLQFKVEKGTYVNFGDSDIHDATNHNQSIKGVPSISEIVLLEYGQTREERRREERRRGGERRASEEMEGGGRRREHAKGVNDARRRKDREDETLRICRRLKCGLSEVRGQRSGAGSSCLYSHRSH